ncbi:Gmad2 immunoglobulin-like domain-containing protein [Rossellomorea aquimaris]|uniref:Gmad2 immunoglobulin-like domain-containing protein n=1 Tax=Rossellomorea aquimaris TaxID=189382 RepID=UPI001CFCCFBD|nr:Gmad2 immunoglobulin-like domain-containing protein [Rossellomorea aquimaris]
MKKLAFIIIFFMIGGLVAYTQQSKEETEKPIVTEIKEVNSPTESESETEVPGDMVYENEAFQDVAVTQSEDEVMVTGKARVFEGVFQYALYAGENEVETSNYQTDGAPAWGEFTITFKNESVTRVELFYYSAKDGSKMGTLEIPISME